MNRKCTPAFKPEVHFFWSKRQAGRRAGGSESFLGWRNDACNKKDEEDQADDSKDE